MREMTKQEILERLLELYLAGKIGFKYWLEKSLQIWLWC